MPGSQEQTARPASLRQEECGPHGDGRHGSGAGSIIADKRKQLLNRVATAAISFNFFIIYD